MKYKGVKLYYGFHGGSAVKNPLANAGVVHLPLHLDDPLGRSLKKEIETHSRIPTWKTL